MAQNFALNEASVSYCPSCSSATATIDLVVLSQDVHTIYLEDGPDRPSADVEGIAGVTLQLDDSGVAEFIRQLQQLRIDLKREERVAEVSGAFT